MSTAVWPHLRTAVPATVRPALPILGLAALVMALLFHAEIAAAVHVWNTSTAYGHCKLVLPIAAFMAYDRRAQAAAAPLRPSPRLALLALPCVALWLLADLLGIMEGRQLALFGIVETLLLAALGWTLWLALSPALLYLVFLVPFGAFLTPMLQHFTAGFIAHGLDTLGIANRVTDNQIEIPEGLFYVAEACAGLRFLIASIALGVLYAVTMYTSPWRRAAFVLAACVVPVLANGVRALGVVVLGHHLGSASAAAADHVLYGWIFFALVTAALALGGMPFRQATHTSPRLAMPPPPGMALRAAEAVWPGLLLAAAAPLLALIIGAGAGAAPPPPANVVIAPTGCMDITPTEIAAPGVQHFTCGETHITARLSMLPHRINPSRLIALAESQPDDLLPGADLDGGLLVVPGGTPPSWVLQRDERAPRALAYTLFIDGAPALGTVGDRIHLARLMLSGAGRPPGVLAVAVTAGRGDAVRTLREFLVGQGDLGSRFK
jgi:exosortase A